MEPGDARDLLDIMTTLWRGGCIVFLLFELSLLLRGPAANAGDSVKEVRWRSTPGEELAAELPTLVTMLSALLILMALDAAGDAHPELAADIFIAILVTAVILHPKHYLLTDRQFFIRGTKYDPGRFTGFKVDDTGGIAAITLEGAAPGFPVRGLRGRSCTIVFSTRGTKDGSSSTGERDRTLLRHAAETLLRKIYN